MKKYLAIILLLLTQPLMAQNLIMIRSKASFPEAMTVLQNSIIEHQYQLSRVQRVDIGLTKAGYKTDLYRVVFYGKNHEYQKITENYPQLMAYLPLKLAIFSEGEETIVSAINPEYFTEMVDDEQTKIMFRRWANDMRSIMHDVQVAE